MSSTEDPRARFRQLPEPVPREELVETVDTEPPPAVETDTEAQARMLRLAGGPV